MSEPDMLAQLIDLMNQEGISHKKLRKTLAYRR
jgi:hypothetical protein